jgi:hypothetical protein
MKKVEFSAGAVFWFALVLAFFGFAFLNVAHAGDLPGSSFALAPVSKVSLIQDKELVLTYAPEKLKAGEIEKTFADISGLVEIEKTAYVGDADFKISICRDVSELKQVCAEYGKEGLSCLKTKEVWISSEKCEETAPSKELTIKSGERIKIEPTKIIYESTPAHPLGEYRVWENLFIGGEKIEGATWWSGTVLTRYLQTLTAAQALEQGATIGSGIYLNQTINGTAFSGNFSLVYLTYFEGTGQGAGGDLHAVIRYINGTILITSNPIAYTDTAGAEKNFTFNSSVLVKTNEKYTVTTYGSSGFAMKADASSSNYFAGGEAQRAENDWPNIYDLRFQFWGAIPDIIAPIIDSCNPANGSSVSTGVTQFLINASDNIGLAALNHTDTFTGTTAYNFTPFNGSAWYVDVNFSTGGTYYWWAAANDTSGNSNQTANCSLIVVAPSTTTTTAPAGNGTVTNVTVSLPGFGWGVLFFIILVSFIVLGGLSKS